MMTQVVLENINPAVLDKLQVLAQSHNRSLEDEVKAILENFVDAELVNQESTQVQAWAKIDAARHRHLGKSFSDSVELLHEDRNY
ncbi:FitA-like ribbon-helix-helix domain-containing protein [Anabaena sp. WFMT]|uniref:FitA-like ribbon-helix-helix domain-containing protein n=1 Tax=Anabaena sp. WFMT TaxID=3449730 RepID=UPI003F26213C